MSSSRIRAVYSIGGFRLDPGKRLLADARGEPVAVTAKAFDALVYLAEHAGELVPRSALVEALWPRTIVEENNLNQAIASLRRVLGEGIIITIPGRGYQLVADVREVDSTPPASESLAVVTAPGTSAPRWRLGVVGGLTLALVTAGYLYFHRLIRTAPSRHRRRAIGIGRPASRFCHSSICPPTRSKTISPTDCRRT